MILYDDGPMIFRAAFRARDMQNAETPAKFQPRCPEFDDEHIMAMRWWIGLLLILTVGGAHINLNVKSSALSRALRGSSRSQTQVSSPTRTFESSDVDAEPTKSHSDKKRSHEHVSLDLSGKFHCHLTAPYSGEARDDDGLTPLFRVGTSTGNGWTPPSLFLSVNYDFSSVWYGATCFLTTLRWNHPPSEAGVDTSSNSPRKRLPSLIAPCTVDLRGGKGLLDRQDYAAELGLTWEPRDEWKSPASLTARLDTKREASVAMMTPIHRRFNVMLKSSFLSSKPVRGFFDSRVPKWSPVGDAWIPDVSLGATGRLVSNNEVGLNPKWTRKRRMGLRLTMSRQLDWSAIGYATDTGSTDTLLRFELCDTGNNGRSYSVIKFEAALEQIVETACFTFAREQVVQSMPK